METIMALVASCGLVLAPDLVSAIVEVESGGMLYAVNAEGAPAYFRNQPAAEVFAQAQIEAGKSVDMGLGQINSDNLESLNLSIKTVFEPCTNLLALQTVFLRGYDLPGDAALSPQEKMMAALSRYNTGHGNRGLDNGYVGKVLAAAAQVSTQAGELPEIAEVSQEATVPDGYEQAKATGR